MKFYTVRITHTYVLLGLFICFLLINNSVQAQSNQDKWQKDGNTATASDYIGTNNNQALILKSDQKPVLKLTPNQATRVMGKLVLENQKDTTLAENRFLEIKPNGKVISTTKSGLLEAVYSSPCLTSPFGNSAFPSPVWQSQSVVNAPAGYLFTGANCPAYVGIGTDIPTQRLDVRGNMYTSALVGVGTQPNNQVQVNTETTRPVGICINHSYNGDFGYAYKGIVNNETTKGIGIYSEVYKKDVFTVYGNGKIEVSNDTEKILQLEADGLLRSRQIRVDLEAWADFVFDEQYNLMPLSDLEAYITKEHHLPNIPSEKVLRETGLDVAEMDKLLMQKIEELTLYIIEQGKHIEDLQKEIEDLKGE